MQWIPKLKKQYYYISASAELIAENPNIRNGRGIRIHFRERFLKNTPFGSCILYVNEQHK